MAGPSGTIPLRLEPIAGPPMSVVEVVVRDQPYILGRSSTCDIVLPDTEGVISRKHCEIRHTNGIWQIADLQSRHGTWLNQTGLPPNQMVTLREGDRLRVGLWTFRIRLSEETTTPRVSTMDDRTLGSGTFRKFAPIAQIPDSHQRLELLMKCAAGMGTAVDELGIAKAATQALISGCGFPRAAVLRGTGGSKTNIDQVEVLSVRDSRQREGEPQNFSRTLLAACAEGQTVVMTSADVPRYGQSIVSLGIGSAICAPVLIDGVPDSYLYVDARATDRSPPISGDSPEVVSFCQAVAHIHSLALANLYRGRLEQDKRRRHAELQSARDVQAIIMPPSSGTHGQLEYAMRSIPGRYVAGDLFDIIPINEHRVAMLLGDVVGKGIAAGMMMANVQAHLYQLLRHGDDPATAATSINAIVNGYSQRFSSERDGASLFLSLFIAVIDAQQRSVRWVDCGHGYWLVRGAGGHARQISGEPGLPVGVVPETQYESCEFALQAGDRLIIYSDGVAEQRSPQGDMFGTDRIATVLVKSTGVHTDAPMLVDAVLAHAAMNVAPGESPFADDVTVASVGLIA